MILNQVATIEIIPTSPFHFDSTFHKPDHFTSGDNLWEPGIRWQTWMWDQIPLGLKFENKGTVERPKIHATVWSDKSLNDSCMPPLTEEIIYRYNLHFDLSEFYKKFQTDTVLGPIMKKLYGMRPGQPSSLYEYLMIGIVLQNATVRRSVQMFQALIEKYGIEIEFDGKKLYCFWSPGRLNGVSEDELRLMKVGYRARSIKRVDEQFENGLIDEMRLRGTDVETQKDTLMQLYGVGPATVWYLLFDVFHQWQYFEHISPWEQKIYSKLFFDKDPENPVPVKKLLAYFNKFGAYKQLAVHYIWEDLWWKRKNEHIPWLEKLIRI